MRFALLIFFPFFIVWLATRSRYYAYRWPGFIALFMVQFISLAPVGAVLYSSYAEAKTEPINYGQNVGKIYSRYTVINRELHGADGWQGIDIAAGCGMPIYAPFSGIVEANNIDHQGNTVLTITSGAIELTLLHGDFLPDVGNTVQAGEIVGTENLHGFYVGAAPICHSHVIYKVNGRSLNWLEYQPSVADYPLRISWYDPSLGGTNCDHDCTTMASGDKVASWIGGRGGVMAAACPRSDGWHHGRRFEIDGVVYECRDTGGWINCYQPGMYDPALKRQADIAYCWVDLLNGSHYQYGSLSYNWGFVQQKR